MTLSREPSASETRRPPKALRGTSSKKPAKAATASRLGNDSPWNAGLAWRVPETNVNLSGALQRGKSNVVVSVVPDDSASLLGPNGFNKPRVGAGDLALSYKCDV